MARWRNAESHYGLMAVLCHWLTAIGVVGLFALGLWMTSLSYYDPWYRTGPDIHRSVGILLTLLVTWRLIWRMLNRPPAPMPNHKLWEKRLAWVVHLTLYLLLFAMFVSGYLITTADGQALHVFNWFSVPAVTTAADLGIRNLEDVAGEVHELVAFTLIGFASLHALAALKHHFFDGDGSLWRMFSRDPNSRVRRR